MQHLKKYIILLGGNIGDVLNTFQATHNDMSQEIGKVIRCSSVYQSQSWGFSTETPFLNQVCEIDSELDANEVMKRLLRIEEKNGRKRDLQAEGYQSRRLDLDILFINDEIINTTQLTVPHPRLHLRNFTLVPLNELMPEYLHPVLKKNIRSLLKESPDNAIITRLC